jgi:signal transduction histidine kinase
MRTMSTRTAGWVAGALAATAVALQSSAALLTYLDRHRLPAELNNWTFPGSLFMDVIYLASIVVSFVIASRRPANRIGWLALAGSLGLDNFSNQYGLHALIAAPGSLPAGRAFAWLAVWIWIITESLFAFFLLLFPNGRLPWPHWRPAAWFMAGAYAVVTAIAIVVATRNWSDPFVHHVTGPLSDAAQLLLIAPVVVALAGLIMRFNRSSGEERLQLKWFAAAAAFAVATYIPSYLGSSAFDALSKLAGLWLLVSICFAVLKYKLYGIDFVISKAVLYGTLIAFITGVYAALVLGVGTAVGDRNNPLLTALAATVVAIAFQPVRLRATRLANRVVYGRRATPYQVLSELTQRVGGVYSHQELLPQMASAIAGATGAERVVIWLRVGDELRPQAVAGLGGKGLGVGAVPVSGQEPPPLPGDARVPIIHRGDLLGAIAIAMPAAEPLSPAVQQLLADVAAQAGLALANAGLIEDLRASRHRLVTAQDEARRRLERDIHDGAQQHLVALAIKLRLAETTAPDFPDVQKALAELREDATVALENLRDLARGIYPPLLADLGLAAALGAQARMSPIPVSIDADGIGRFPQETEAAVYFCCLEALQNVAKYAKASQARIALARRDNSLCFSVTDDGAGYDTRRTPMGSGLRNMADRLAALGGQLQLRSAPGQGTTLTATLPLPS